MEQYYRVSIDPLPKLRFIFFNESTEYLWEAQAKPMQLQMNYVITGSIQFRQGDRSEIVPQGQAFFLHRSDHIKAWSDSPLYQEFTSGIHLNAPCTIADEQEIASLRYVSTEAIIPMRIQDPSVCRQFYNLLTALGTARKDAANPVRMMLVKARLYDIFALLTKYSLHRARQRCYLSSADQNNHCRKACLYIRDNITKRIRAEDVARSAGISYRQLAALFQQYVGTTLTDYINQEKIQRIKHLIITENISLEAAGEAFGFPNVKYLSTLFHKYTGMTVRDCKKLSKK